MGYKELRDLVIPPDIRREWRRQERRSMRRALLKGLTIGAYPQDYPERDLEESNQRIEWLYKRAEYFGIEDFR